MRKVQQARRLWLVGAMLHSLAAAAYSFLGYAMACSLAPTRGEKFATTHVYVWVSAFLVFSSVALLIGVAWIRSLLAKSSSEVASEPKAGDQPKSL